MQSSDYSFKIAFIFQDIIELICMKSNEFINERAKVLISQARHTSNLICLPSLLIDYKNMALRIAR